MLLLLLPLSVGCGGGLAAPDDGAVTFDVDAARPAVDFAVGCVRDSDCKAGQRCDPGSRACVACLADRDCAAGEVCLNHACVPGCNAQHGCGDAGVCEVDAGACAECLRDKDCLDPAARHCDPARLRCAACLPSSDDCPHGTYCATVGDAFACQPGCKNEGDCAQGQKCCAARCLDVATDAANCGSCGNACAGNTPACCGGACLDVASSPMNCGGCGMACKTANATAACVMKACSIAACDAGWADCDANAGDGCEVNIAGDAANCGKCGFRCAIPNAAAFCAAGACVIAACNAGFLDCNHQSNDGCEVDTRADPLNCGACGNPCSALPHSSASCVASTCTIGMCDAGFGDCNKQNADGCESRFSADPANCGGCGKACPAPPNVAATCANSVCGVAGCNMGFGDCDNNGANGCEANFAVDAANCGACGVACPLGATCVNAKCTSLFGSGKSGPLLVNANTTFTGYFETHLAAPAMAAAGSVTVVSAANIVAGDKVLIINVRSAQNNAGYWEVADVTSVNLNVLGLAGTLVNNYPEPANTLVRTLPQYTDVTVAANTTLGAAAWNPATLTGGIIAFFAAGTVTVNGRIAVNGLGYRGGVGDNVDPGNNQFKMQGESFPGVGQTGLANNVPNGGGGGGGVKRGGCEGSGGGGGGYAMAGLGGGANVVNCGNSLPGATGGLAYGDAQLARIYFGSGGGSGGYTTDPALGAGGGGGGMILVFTSKMTINGSVEARGGDGTAEFGDYGGGGGGAGGSIYLRTQQAVVGANNLIVTGGAGGPATKGIMEVGGSGSPGRTRLDLRP